MILFMQIFFSIASAITAEQKGRNAILWGVLGFLFGIFAFIIVLCLPEEEN
jgi:predicted cobalt transporter CbtA